MSPESKNLAYNKFKFNTILLHLVLLTGIIGKKVYSKLIKIAIALFQDIFNFLKISQDVSRCLKNKIEFLDFKRVSSTLHPHVKFSY